MIFIKRIITIIASVLGASIGIIAMGLFNWSLHLGLSFGDAFLYGLVGGIVFGIVAGYMLMYYFIRRTKRFLYTKISGVLSRMNMLTLKNLIL